MFLKIKPVNTPIAHWHTGLVCVCAVVILLIATIYVARHEYDFIKTSARAKGIVIAQNAGKHHVQIRFTTNDGKSIDYAQNGLISYEVGDHVAILYAPDDPGTHVSTDAIGSLWIGTISFSMFTFGALLVSILSIFFPRFVSVPS
jgi:hypothetical protein